jgi:penicillin-binding protein 2
MPSEEWKMKTQHEKWYAGETISVGIGQGAVTVTPIQLARMIAGVTSGGALVRPHVVVPDDLPAEYRTAVYENFPGSAATLASLNPANWEIITDGMAAATDPKADGTASASHLDGIDFAGKTGTAQVISHEGLAKGAKGHDTKPNAWFVGVTPRRNPDFVVAVLWENGDWGSNSARLGAQVVAAYVEKQRRLNNNLQEANTPKPPPTEVSAIWSAPANTSEEQGRAPQTGIRSGRFLVNAKGEAVRAASKAASVNPTLATKNVSRMGHPDSPGMGPPVSLVGQPAQKKLSAQTAPAAAMLP